MEDYNSLFKLIGPDCSDIIIKYIKQLINSECREEIFKTNHFNVMMEFRMTVQMEIDELNRCLEDMFLFLTSSIDGPFLWPSMFQYMYPTFSETVFKKISFTQRDLNIINGIKNDEKNTFQEWKYNDIDNIEWEGLQIQLHNFFQKFG